VSEFALEELASTPNGMERIAVDDVDRLVLREHIAAPRANLILKRLLIPTLGVFGACSCRCRIGDKILG